MQQLGVAGELVDGATQSFIVTLGTELAPEAGLADGLAPLARAAAAARPLGPSSPASAFGVGCMLPPSPN